MTNLFLTHKYHNLVKFNTLNLATSVFKLERERESYLASFARKYSVNYLIFNDIACLNLLDLSKFFCAHLFGGVFNSVEQYFYTLPRVSFPKVSYLNFIAVPFKRRTKRCFAWFEKIMQDIPVQKENCMYVFVNVSGKGNRDMAFKT